jgi:hypothetical protein
MFDPRRITFKLSRVLARSNSSARSSDVAALADSYLRETEMP